MTNFFRVSFYGPSSQSHFRQRKDTLQHRNKFLPQLKGVNLIWIQSDKASLLNKVKTEIQDRTTPVDGPHIPETGDHFCEKYEYNYGPILLSYPIFQDWHNHKADTNQGRNVPWLPPHHRIQHMPHSHSYTSARKLDRIWPYDVP